MTAALWRTRPARVLLGADAATAAICAFLPLADHLDFEFAQALTVVSALVAPFVGFAAMRLELKESAESRRPARAAALAGGVAVAALLLPVVVILLNGLRRPLCDPLEGMMWMLVLPVPTAWLSAAVGALIGLKVERQWKAVLLMGTIELAVLVFTVASTYFGPAYFAFDHFFGYFPGPMYRNAIPISPALMSFRLATVLWGVAAVTAAGALASADRTMRRVHRNWCAALVILLVCTSVFRGSDLNWRTTDRSLREVLAGELRVDHLVLHYPLDWSERAVDRFMHDAAFDAAELEREIGVVPKHPIHVWIYPSVAVKGRLVGADVISFAKPYRHEIHIHVRDYPHTAMRHELVHALGAELAGGPFGTPGFILPNETLVEGFAEAYDVEDPPLTLLQRAKAMRELRIAPNIDKMLEPRGFSGVATRRAYSYAGAFIQYLRTRFDREAMQRLYATGNISALGVPDSLFRGFERSLDTVHVDLDGRSVAQRNYARPRMREQRCPHEVNALADSATSLSLRRRYSASLALFDRVCAMAPDDPELLARKLDVAIRMREAEPTRVMSIARALFSHPQLRSAMEASARTRVGDELWRRGDTAGARAQFVRASTLAADPYTHRELVVRLRALDDSSLAAAIKPLLLGDIVGLPSVFRLLDASAAHPRQALLLYLLGSRSISTPDKAAEFMERADSLGLGDIQLTRENLRTLVVARAEGNKCDAAEGVRTRLKNAGGSAADDAVAADRIARCRFAVSRGWAPI